MIWKTAPCEAQNCIEVGADFFKSKRSNPSGNCVEVGRPTGDILVRDTKDRDGGTLAFSADAWGIFIRSIQNDEL